MSNNKTIFNDAAKGWNKNIPKINYEIAYSIIEKFNIGYNCSVLDVACGTGIIYSILKDKNLSGYIGVDISSNMIKEFLLKYPNVDVRQMDFESKVFFEKQFDYIIIFNSIPHFTDLNAVFENAYNNLNSGGTFIIAHSKTREGLREHHRKIGYVSDKKDPIPSDIMLQDLSEEYGFSYAFIQDEEYFSFSCKKIV